MIFLCWAALGATIEGCWRACCKYSYRVTFNTFWSCFDFPPTNDSTIGKVEVLGAVDVDYLRCSFFFIIIVIFTTLLWHSNWNSLEYGCKAQRNREAYTTWTFLFFSFFFFLAVRLYTHFLHMLAESTSFTCLLIFFFNSNNFIQL